MYSGLLSPEPFDLAVSRSKCSISFETCFCLLHLPYLEKNFIFQEPTPQEPQHQSIFSCQAWAA